MGGTEEPASRKTKTRKKERLSEIELDQPVSLCGCSRAAEERNESEEEIEYLVKKEEGGEREDTQRQSNNNRT